MNFETSTHSEKSKILPFPIARQGATQFDRTQEAVPGPIEQKMRKTLDSLKGCKYPDEYFDWSVYDKIAAKFEEPPRGGVVFNTSLKLVNFHASCSKCHYSLEIDSYGRGCFHDCTYCYAKDQLSARRYWNNPQPFPVNLAELRSIFYKVFETDKTSKWRDILQKRIPIRVGSMSDSFMYIDSRYGVTKELIRIFNFYKYPHIFFTRSDLAAHDDYIEIIDPNLCAIQYSVSGNNSKLIRAIEPGAPSFKRRLNAVRKLNENGIWATVRINPMFPKYPDGYFSRPDEIKHRFGAKSKVPVFPIYTDSFIEEIAESGVQSLVAGFVRLSGISINRIEKATSIPIRTFFRPEEVSKPGRSEARYTDEEIGHYYQWFHRECEKHGIRFNTCYIGNGIKDFYQYQHLWSNSSKDCCDVVGVLSSFKKTCQSIPWNVREKHSPCKSDCKSVQNEESNMEKLYQNISPIHQDPNGLRI